MKILYPRSHKILPKEIKDKIHLNLLEYSFDHIKSSITISFLCASILFVGLYPYNKYPINLYSWYLLFISITICRAIFTSYFKSTTLTSQSYPFWRNLFILGALAGGLSWGFVIIYVFPTVSNNQQTLCIFVLAGITAGSITTLSSIRPAIFGFLTCALVPLIIELTLINNFINNLFIFTVVVYFIFLLIISLNIHYTVKNVIFLQYENDHLLEQLHFNATHDALTNLDNSRQFYANIAVAMDQADNTRYPFGLLFIDIDHFKEVNDAHGHDIGDKLLIAIAERIQKSVRKADKVARIGGDEFTIIVEQAFDKETLSNIAKNICAKIQEPFIISNIHMAVTASIGISIYPYHNSDVLKLLKTADQAMYYVKKHGKNNYHFADDNS